MKEYKFEVIIYQENEATDEEVMQEVKATLSSWFDQEVPIIRSGFAVSDATFKDRG